MGRYVVCVVALGLAWGILQDPASARDRNCCCCVIVSAGAGQKDAGNGAVPKFGNPLGGGTFPGNNIPQGGQNGTVQQPAQAGANAAPTASQLRMNAVVQAVVCMARSYQQSEGSPRGWSIGKAVETKDKSLLLQMLPLIPGLLELVNGEPNPIAIVEAAANVLLGIANPTDPVPSDVTLATISQQLSTIQTTLNNVKKQQDSDRAQLKKLVKGFK